MISIDENIEGNVVFNCPVCDKKLYDFDNGDGEPCLHVAMI